MPAYTGSILNAKGFEFHNWPGAGEEAAAMFGLSHAVIVPANARRVIIGGQVGIRDDGEVPTDVAEEVDVAFSHVEAALVAAGLPAENAWQHVYQVRTYEVPAEGLRDGIAHAAVKYLGATRPAWTGITIAGLFSPELHLEIEVEAYLPQWKM